MGFYIQGSLSEELHSFGLPPAAAAFVTRYDWCYSNDRDIPESYPRDVFKVCLFVAGAYQVLETHPIPLRNPEGLDSQKLSQIFRRKGVTSDIVGFLELLECLESMKLFPSEYLTKLDPICRWMKEVQPANSNGQSVTWEQRNAAAQQLVGRLSDSQWPFPVAGLIGEFFLDYLHAKFPLPIPEPEWKSTFQGLIDHVSADPAVQPQLPLIKEFLRSLRVCEVPAYDSFRQLWKVFTVPDEEFVAVIQSLRI